MDLDWRKRASIVVQFECGEMRRGGRGCGVCGGIEGREEESGGRVVCGGIIIKVLV